MTYRILVVDDEPDILEFVGYNLRREGFEVFTSTNGRDAVDMALDKRPHLIILDVMMPLMDGIETCRRMREFKQLDGTIITFLTARNEDYSQLAGFGAGADDYISKLIRPKVLVTKIKALLKRADHSAHNEPRTGIYMDRERYVAVDGATEVSLPRKEFDLLELLVSKPGKVFTREEIFSLVWGDDVIVGDRTIDVHVRKLREKIGGERIVTIKGVGYKYEDEPGRRPDKITDS